MQNCPVQASVNSTECLTNYQKHKQARQDRKDQPWRRLATFNKIAQVKGWNLPTYREPRNLETLLKTFGEYAYLTGKRLGTYYLSTLDLDWKKEEFPVKLINYLEKSAKKLVKFLQTSYDQTKKGLHVDILTPEPLKNGIIYWADKLGKKWVIVSIQSRGKYVVGEDPNKTFIKNGEWYWKTQTNQEIKATLSKFFFEFKETEQLTTQKPTEAPVKPLLPTLPNSNTSTINIHAKILSKQKIPVSDLWKFFYSIPSKNQEHQGYFLANGHTQNLTDLRIGAVKNIRLIQGRKHIFFSRLL